MSAPEQENGEAAAEDKAEVGAAAEEPSSGSRPAENDPPPSSKRTAKDPLVEALAESAKYRDQLLRTAADFDNFRKRARRDVEDAHRKGAEELLKILLPVFDNLERAVVHAEQAPDAKAIGDGVRMVLKQFTDTLERAGISRVAGVGKPFDPLVHEAIQQVETKDHPAGTVVAEVQPGYKQGERLIRAAMVVVAKAPSTPSTPAAAS